MLSCCQKVPVDGSIILPTVIAWMDISQLVLSGKSLQLATENNVTTKWQHEEALAIWCYLLHSTSTVELDYTWMLTTKLTFLWIKGWLPNVSVGVELDPKCFSRSGWCSARATSWTTEWAAILTATLWGKGLTMSSHSINLWNGWSVSWPLVHP